jgi:hypothetical protein
MPVRKTAARRRKPSRKSSRKISTQKRSALVLGDMLAKPSLSLSRAARKRRIDARTVLKLMGSDFEKDSSGRIKPRRSDRKRQTLFIPGFEAGREIPVATKSASERRLIGRWMAALNAAGRGNFSKIDKFPRNKTIGGVLLRTNRADVQRILKALADKESPFEHLYRTLRRPS